jgi:hypothetical protein
MSQNGLQRCDVDFGVWSDSVGAPSVELLE